MKHVSRHEQRLAPTGYVRERTCIRCEAVETVRKDNKSETCKSCAAKISGAKGIATIQSRKQTAACENCGCQMFVTASHPRRFCSMECRRAAQSVARVCETCGGEFRVCRSKLSGKTNSSARFCSRPCYEKHLCRTDRVTGRGSQWNAARKEALRRAPFCALCGTRKNLQVHHAIPFRLTRDNSQENLFPLCVKHHRFVESIFVETEKFGIDEQKVLLWQVMLRDRQMATGAYLMKLFREVHAQR